MATPPRSPEELYAYLLGVFPSWLKEPDELAKAHLLAIAGQFSRSQFADQTLHDRTFIGLADGTWLDEHGRERGKFRRPGESEESFRFRVRQVDDKVTRSSILIAVNAILTTGSATMTEHPVNDPSFVPPAGTTFLSLGIVGKSNSFVGRRAYTLSVPDQAPVSRNTAFTSDPTTLPGASKTRTFTWDDPVSGSAPQPGMYTSDTDGPLALAIYSRIMEILDDYTAAGVQTRPIVI